MDLESVLQVREVKPSPIDSIPITACTRGSCCAFVESNGKIIVFDTSSGKRQELPAPEKNIKGHPKALEISLDQKYICVLYTDGNIQSYDIATNSRYKIISNQKGKISAMAFLNPEVLLYSIGANLFSSKSLTSRGIFKSGDVQLSANINSNVKKLIIPEIYRYEVTNKGSTATCKFPLLADIVAITTETEIQIVRIGPKELEELYSNIISDPIFAFNLPNNNKIDFIVANKSSIEVLNLEINSGATLLYQSKLTRTPIFATPLSSLIMAIITDDGIINIYFYTENNAIQIPFPGGHEQVLVSENNIIMAFGSDKLNKISLVSFETRIEELTNSNDVDGIISFCKRALSGEKLCIVGLHEDPNFRSILIEQSLANALAVKIQERLEDKSQSTEVISKLINLWTEMGLRSEITNTIMNIFTGENLSKEYFEAIIKADPNADRFIYTKDFAAQLMKTPEVHNTEFLMSLSSLIMPTEELLRYGLLNNRSDLLRAVYMQRLDQPLNAVRVVANSGDFEGVADIIVETVTRKDTSTHQQANLIVRWVLALNNRVHFPRLSKLLSINMEEKALNSVFRIEDLIERRSDQVKLTPDQFINAYIIALGESTAPVGGLLYEQAEKMLKKLSKRNGFLTVEAATKIAHAIFKEETDESFRRRLAGLLIGFDLQSEFFEAFAALCERFGLYKEMQMSRCKAGHFETAIQDAIANPVNCFANIDAILEMRSEEIEKTEFVIMDNAPRLIARNVEEFASLIIKFFPAKVLSVLDYVPEEKMKNYYLHEVSKRLPDIRIPKDLQVEYVTFLCGHFPNEVRVFIEANKKEDLSVFSRIVRQYKVFDACALIEFFLHNMKSFSEYLTQFFEIELVRYASGVITEEECKESVQFAIRFMMGLGEEESALAKNLIKAFGAPIYLAHNDGDTEREEVLEDMLKESCKKLFGILTYDEMLEIVVGEFHELPLGSLRATIGELVKDYAYDVDAATALSKLIAENCEDAYLRYVKAELKGTLFRKTRCATCDGRLSDTNSILVFRCGHAFHDDPSCVAKATCPVCHPGTLLSDEVPRAANLPKLRNVERVLKVFESRVAGRDETRDTRFFSNVKSDINIEIKTMVCLPN